MPPQLLYRFRVRDPRTGKWYTARYRATPEEIRARYGEEFELLDAEVRQPLGGSFNPYRKDGEPDPPCG
jgi:hypothetical protein